MHKRATKWVSPAVLLVLLVGVMIQTGCWDTGGGCGAPENASQSEEEARVGFIQGLNSSTTATAPAPDESVEKPVLGIGNPMAVQNGGTSPEWTIETPMKVTSIDTYHWNDAQGAPPGTISLESADGKTYGPWQAEGLPGQNNVPNATWIVKPNEVVQPGTYKVIDSDPKTWSQNGESNGFGFTNVYAQPAK